MAPARCATAEFTATTRSRCEISAAPDMVDTVRRMMGDKRGAIFIILDSDHSTEHVLREMEAYVPMMVSGDYLVVEDTCINGHPVRKDFGPGPWEAVEIFLKASGPAAT